MRLLYLPCSDQRTGAEGIRRLDGANSYDVNKSHVRTPFLFLHEIIESVREPNDITFINSLRSNTFMPVEFQGGWSSRVCFPSFGFFEGVFQPRVNFVL